MVPWPIMLRDRVHERVAGSSRYPSAGALRGVARPLLGRLHHHDPVRVDPSHRRASSGATPAPSHGWSPARCWRSPWSVRRWASSATCTAIGASTACRWSAWRCSPRSRPSRGPRASLIAFRTLGAATGAAVGPGLDRHHQPAVPARATRAGDGLLVDGRRRRPGGRRRRGWAHRGDVRVALDLRRPGAAHPRWSRAGPARASRDASGASAPCSTTRAPSFWPLEPHRSWWPSTAVHCGGGRARRSWSPSSSLQSAVVAFAVIERRVPIPLLPLALPAAAELHLRRSPRSASRTSPTWAVS